MFESHESNENKAMVASSPGLGMLENSCLATSSPRGVLVGVNVAQGGDLSGYLRFLQKTERGQRLLTFKGWGVNGR